MYENGSISSELNVVFAIATLIELLFTSCVGEKLKEGNISKAYIQAILLLLQHVDWTLDYYKTKLFRID